MGKSHLQRELAIGWDTFSEITTLWPTTAPKSLRGSPVAESTGMIFVAFEATGTAVCAKMAAVVVCGSPLTTGTSGSHCASIPPFFSTRASCRRRSVSFCARRKGHGLSKGHTRDVYHVATEHRSIEERVGQEKLFLAVQLGQEGQGRMHA